MVTGFKNDAGGSFHGLRGEQGRDIARETNFDSRFSQGFEDDVNKRGTTGRKTGDRVHVFFVDDNNPANRIEHSFGNFEVLGQSVRTAADTGHADAYGRTGVRHGANDGNLLGDALLDVGSRNRGGHGDNQRAFAKGRLNFFQYVADNLRLYGEKDNVSIFDGVAVICGDVDPQILGKRSGFFCVPDSGGDMFWGEKILLEIGTQENAAEFAGAENREMLVRKFESHGQIIVTEERRRVNYRDWCAEVRGREKAASSARVPRDDKAREKFSRAGRREGLPLRDAGDGRWH